MKTRGQAVDSNKPVPVISDFLISLFNDYLFPVININALL